MKQLALLQFPEAANRLESFVKREGNLLLIPEGLDTTPGTHGMHRFPGKFIPNIPRYIIRSILHNDKDRIIFDPFCGSGTTLVEAALERRPFLGLDIDPLSVTIATAKAQPLSEDKLRSLEKFWENHDYRKECPEVVPRVPRLSHWFTDRAIRELSSIKANCLELPPRPRLFSLVVFSSIIRRVSNADDQSQKTYVSHTLPKNPPAPSVVFPVFLKRAVQGMRQYLSLLPREPRGSVLKGDARKDIDGLEFNDIITSPPYIDSIDYVYNQLLEYFWLLPELGIHSYERLRELRKEPMGFSNNYSKTVLKEFAKTYLPTLAGNFEDLCSRIGKKSPKEEVAVRSFFMDYAKHLGVVRRKQRPGDYYVCIVGNSYIRGNTVPTADIVVDIHTSIGYNLVDRMIYSIRRHYMKFPRRSNSRKIEQDHILVFRVG